MSSDGARPCPACAEVVSVAFGEKNGFLLTRCSRCQSIFTARLPEGEEAEDYSGYYHPANLEVPPVVHRSLNVLVRRMAVHRRTNRWLDVGSGAGALLDAGARQGWDMTGTEIAQLPAKAMSSAGFEVREGDLAQLELPSAAFDVVTIVEVIEHAPDPFAMLAEARRVLRPGGVLYLTTPHARGLSGRGLGPRWSVVSPPEHVQLFSIRGLRALCTRAGLRERSLQVHGLNPHELRQLLPFKRGAPDVTATDRVATGYRVNETLTRRPAGIWVKTIINGMLSGSRLGDVLKLEAQRPPDSTPTPAQT